MLSFPGKVAADATGGRLLITDSNHNRIIITDRQGSIRAVIGSGKMGNRDGSFAAAEFNHPQGVCLNGDTLYIADTENHLIRAANLKTGEVKTILGNGKQPQNPNVDGTGVFAELNSPWDLTTWNHRLYIAMAGAHQLWVADLTTLHVAPYAGTGIEARVDGPLTMSALAQPSGITTDGDQIYFVDSETSSIRTAAFRAGGKVETIVGQDLFVYGDVDGDRETARLQHPLGIACRGRIAVCRRHLQFQDQNCRSDQEDLDDLCRDWQAWLCRRRCCHGAVQ